MLVGKINEDLLKENALPIHFGPCSDCDSPAAILMRGYKDKDDILLCKFHALQLARKLIEDVCDIEGDRHG